MMSPSMPLIYLINFFNETIHQGLDVHEGCFFQVKFSQLGMAFISPKLLFLIS